MTNSPGDPSSDASSQPDSRKPDSHGHVKVKQQIKSKSRIKVKRHLSLSKTRLDSKSALLTDDTDPGVVKQYYQVKSVEPPHREKVKMKRRKTPTTADPLVREGKSLEAMKTSMDMNENTEAKDSDPVKKQDQHPDDLFKTPFSGSSSSSSDSFPESTPTSKMAPKSKKSSLIKIKVKRLKSQTSLSSSSNEQASPVLKQYFKVVKSTGNKQKIKLKRRKSMTSVASKDSKTELDSEDRPKKSKADEDHIEEHKPLEQATDIPTKLEQDKDKAIVVDHLKENESKNPEPKPVIEVAKVSDDSKEESKKEVIQEVTSPTPELKKVDSLKQLQDSIELGKEEAEESAKKKKVAAVEVTVENKSSPNEPSEEHETEEKKSLKEADQFKVEEKSNETKVEDDNKEDKKDLQKEETKLDQDRSKPHDVEKVKDDEPGHKMAMVKHSPSPKDDHKKDMEPSDVTPVETTPPKVVIKDLEPLDEPKVVPSKPYSPSHESTKPRKMKLEESLKITPVSSKDKTIPSAKPSITEAQGQPITQGEGDLMEGGGNTTQLGGIILAMVIIFVAFYLVFMR